MSDPRKFARAGLAAAFLALSSCSGSSSELSTTEYTGIVVLPVAGCEGCSSETQPVFGRLLCEGAAPSMFDESVTSDLGVYALAKEGDLGVCNGAPANSEGQDRAVIIVSTVREADPARGVKKATIGGVLTSTVGLQTSKDFDGGTYIACVAAVYLTRGAVDGRNAPCNVAPGPPADLTSEAILLLEDASAIAADAITYTDSGDDPEGQTAEAACAVIQCTGRGATPADASCVCGELGLAVANGRCVRRPRDQ